MYRVVFCPSDETMHEAEELARKVQLPILLGRNERLSDVEFDDSVVSVVSVPVDRYAVYQELVPEVGAPQVVVYVDDYEDLTEAVLRVDHDGLTELHNPIEQEKHMVRFAFRTAMNGVHNMSIVVGSSVVADGVFTVGGAE